MAPLRRVIAPVCPPPQTPSAASASVPGCYTVVVVVHEHHDARGAPTTRCITHVDQVICASERVQLIHTDAGLVMDLPAAATAQLAVHDHS
jgi:hypothetical protein